MTIQAFILIFLSASAHAAWNLLAKKGRMSVPFYTVICGCSCLCWLHVQFWTPVDVLSLPAKFWLYILGSVLSDSMLYCLGLVMTYRYLDMSTAYPVMRSLPILFTLFFTQLMSIGKPLAPMAIWGCVVLFCGCLLMPLKRFGEIKLSTYMNQSLVFIIMAALGTTGYTIFDSQAQHALGNAVTGIAKPILSMTYYSTRGILLTTSLLLITMSRSSYRCTFADFFRQRNYMPALAGVMASCSYILVLFSMNYVTNVSYVQVFRQMGLPLGMIAGIFFLKERGAMPKYIGVTMIVAGLCLTVI